MVYGSDPFSYDFSAALEGREAKPDTSAPYWFENWMLGLPAPSKEQLERHRALFGADCVQIPKEARSIQELREAGHSVRQIAHMTGKSERSVRVLLRVGGDSTK